ncbi:hypothetical protein FO519_004115 [Halicephalobus sp. NKZ332]|nr:hypothetical protein FO519_004115 [Halicephalobus sp. NKZ332]
MSSFWEFVKRHKGKIVVGSVAVGGLYTAKKVYDSELLENLTANSVKRKEQEEQLLVARKHFIFDSHQQSCDKGLTESIVDIRNIIRSRYPVENIVETVKEPDLPPEEKIRVFEDIKLKSFARIISTSFAYSLVIVASKTQKSIICSETCKNIQKKRTQEAGSSGVINYVQSLIFGEEESKRRSTFTDPKVQQVFVNCIQFLTTSGLSQLFNKIDGVVEELLLEYPLGKGASISDFESLLETAVERIEKEVGSNNFANLIVPITNVHTKFNGQDATQLEELLTHFVTLIQLPSCRKLMSLFVRRFTSKAIQFLKDDLGSVSQPVAKFLPSIADSFSAICKNVAESPFQDCLHSHELHQFTLMAFGSESVKDTIEFGLD